MVSERLDAIKSILLQKEIETQDQLQKEVEGLGFHVTQATISRDIAKLNLIKKRNYRDRVVYTLPEQDNLAWITRQMLLKVEQAQNMLVVKVKPGSANLLAAEIDALAWKELVGTVAGDDTVLLISKTNKEAKNLMSKILKANS